MSHFTGLVVLTVCGVEVIASFVTVITIEFKWLEQLWNHGLMFETGVVQTNEC